MKQLILFGALALLVACRTSKNTDKNKEVPLLTAKIGKGISPIETQITDVVIQGNELQLTVSYTGGCEKHTFELVGSNALSKSLPPIRNLSLLNSTEKTDNCEKQITEKLRFDLRPVAYKQEAGSTIRLTLNGWEKELSYTYE